jgi:site-specific DNA-methyltransferase (adenine-specific)
MAAQRSLTTKFVGEPPDILDCIAALSNDEIPTPPWLANQMLDLLPTEVWEDATLRWLDPFTKSGVFLREVARRLLWGVAEGDARRKVPTPGLTVRMPDEDTRREHVFRQMLYGIPITELCGELSRRSLYYTPDASSEWSVVPLEHAEGNIRSLPGQHTFVRTGGCRICGAPRELDGRENRENYAYSFIHDVPMPEEYPVKFDVIVGNPPYQLGSTGGNAKGSFAMPVYQKFVERAIALDPRFVLMITPSRWFAGGRNLDQFRSRMLSNRQLRYLVDYPNTQECFPEADISGGVSYFLWDQGYDGPCRISSIQNGELLDQPADRLLDEHDTLVRYNTGVDIVRKVWSDPDHVARVSETVSPIQPFSLRTNFRGEDSPDGKTHPVAVWGSKGYSYIEYQDVPRNLAWVGKWKVLLGRAYGDRGPFPYKVTSAPTVLPPGTACTETYLVIDMFDDEDEARRFAAYLTTRFVRFLISLRKYTQDIYNERFAFVPALPMDRTWNDEDLYARYRLSDDEIAFIESQIKEMSPPPAYESATAAEAENEDVA